MCVDCGPIESNTGVIVYSGPTLTLCNDVTISNGEFLTTVIQKIDSCIGVLQNELDITGLVENSDCINLTKTSLQTVLQSILDTESEYCTRLSNLDTQITNIQNQLNNIVGAKNIDLVACDSSRIQKTVDTATQKTFKINGLIPPNTILPYFGPLTDFSTTGLGLPNTPMAGWAIANGNAHTIGSTTYQTINVIGSIPNDLGNFIKYGPEVKFTNPNGTFLGSNTVRLKKENIPATPLLVTANFTLSGETNEAGKHSHKIKVEYEEGGDSCVDVSNPDAYDWGDNPLITRGIETAPSSDCGSRKQLGYSGLHKHTFTAEATGSFSATVGSTEPDEFNITPKHIQAIPIQWIGAC